MGRPYTSDEIVELIKGDNIVIAACPTQKMQALHGKFVSKIVDGNVVFCFCPFKKGLNFEFRPAEEWVHAEAKDAAMGVAEALMAGRKSRR